MNDCQINESQKLFVISSFLFRFMVTLTVLLLYEKGLNPGVSVVRVV